MGLVVVVVVNLVINKDGKYLRLWFLYNDLLVYDFSISLPKNSYDHEKNEDGECSC
jgi:hypothetical protein